MKWIMGLLGVVTIGVLGAFLINGCSTINARPDAAEIAREQQSAQWAAGKFANPQPMWSDVRGTVTGLFESTQDQVPSSPVPVVSDGGATLRTPSVTVLRVTWFGHSSVFLEIDGTKILIDPLWSERASPVSWAGPKRWYPPPIAL